MKTICTWVMILITASVMLSGCGGGGDERSNRRNFTRPNAGGGGFEKPDRPRFKIPVTVTRLERERMYAYTQEVGSIVPIKQVEIKPEYNGRIYYTQKWMEGDEVKAGQVFARIDDRDLRIDLRDAELNLEKAKAAVHPASAQLAQAIKDEEFSERMFKRDAISKQEWDNSILARIQQENQYEEALKNIESARMQMEKIQQELEKIEIVVPFDGVLLPAEESVSAGQSSDSSAIDLTLNHGQTVTSGQLLCRLADIEQVYAALDVPAKDLLEVEIGQKVELDIYSRVGTNFEGVVHDISTGMNRSTRTHTVNVLIANEGHELRPGMFVIANIITEEKPAAIKIPREIIQVRNNQEIVFVVKEKEVEEPSRKRLDQDQTEDGVEPAARPREVASNERSAYAAEGETQQNPNNRGEDNTEEESGREGLSGPPDQMQDEMDDEAFEEEPEEEPEMIAEKRVITRGIENREFVEVVDGLREGELLVVIGFETLTDGVDVSVNYDTDESMDISSASN